jgi:tetratricopeptide (TPR) repeat protein
MGEPKRALEDLNTAIQLKSNPSPLSLFSRGLVHRRMGEYETALKDFANGEAIDPEKWEKDIVFGLLYQADAHACLGNEQAALSYCARLPDDFWTPGVYGAPGGDKAEVAYAQRWSHFLTQPAKVGSPMQRTTHHEDAETVFG